MAAAQNFQLFVMDVDIVVFESGNTDGAVNI